MKDPLLKKEEAAKILSMGKSLHDKCLSNMPIVWLCGRMVPLERHATDCCGRTQRGSKTYRNVNTTCLLTGESSKTRKSEEGL